MLLENFVDLRDLSESNSVVLTAMMKTQHVERADFHPSAGTMLRHGLSSSKWVPV